MFIKLLTILFSAMRQFEKENFALFISPIYLANLFQWFGIMLTHVSVNFYETISQVYKTTMKMAIKWQDWKEGG